VFDATAGQKLSASPGPSVLPRPFLNPLLVQMR